MQDIAIAFFFSLINFIYFFKKLYKRIAFFFTFIKLYFLFFSANFTSILVPFSNRSMTWGIFYHRSFAPGKELYSMLTIQLQTIEPVRGPVVSLLSLLHIRRAHIYRRRRASIWAGALHIARVQFHCLMQCSMRAHYHHHNNHAEGVNWKNPDDRPAKGRGAWGRSRQPQFPVGDVVCRMTAHQRYIMILNERSDSNSLEIAHLLEWIKPTHYARGMVSLTWDRDVHVMLLILFRTVIKMRV